MTTDGNLFERLKADERPPAVVAAVQLPGVTDEELASSLEELERLARTLGLEPVGRVIQQQHRPDPGPVYLRRSSGRLPWPEAADHGGAVPVVQRQAHLWPEDRAGGVQVQMGGQG